MHISKWFLFTAWNAHWQHLIVELLSEGVSLPSQLYRQGAVQPVTQTTPHIQLPSAVVSWCWGGFVWRVWLPQQAKLTDRLIRCPDHETLHWKRFYVLVTTQIHQASRTNNYLAQYRLGWRQADQTFSQSSVELVHVLSSHELRCAECLFQTEHEACKGKHRSKI